jgi:hypothetical protein
MPRAASAWAKGIRPVLSDTLNSARRGVIESGEEGLFISALKRLKGEAGSRARHPGGG